MSSELVPARQLRAANTLGAFSTLDLCKAGYTLGHLCGYYPSAELASAGFPLEAYAERITQIGRKKGIAASSCVSGSRNGGAAKSLLSNVMPP